MITNEMANLELGVHSGRQTQLALVGERGIISGSACKRLKREGEDNRRDEWSTEAVTCLLDVYEAKWNQRSRGNLKGGDWEEVAARVSARGGGHRLPKTPFQCKKKVASMKQKYSSETLLRGLSESAGTCRWPFFERMDVMLRVNATGSGKDDDGDDQQAATPTAGVSCGGGGPQGGGAEEELRHHQPPRDALPVDAAEGRLQAMVASMMRLQEPGDESGDSDSAGDEEEVIGTAEAAGAVVIRGGVHHATTAKTTAGYGGLRQQHHACDEDHPHGHYNHENSVQEDASNTVGPHAGKPGTNESRESTPKSRAPPFVAAAAGARVMKHDHHRIADMQHNMMSASKPRTAAGGAAVNHHEARGGNGGGGRKMQQQQQQQQQQRQKVYQDMVMLAAQQEAELEQQQQHPMYVLSREIAVGIRALAESMVKMEEAKMEMWREAERRRGEQEARRLEAELKRTEMITSTQLQIAKLLCMSNNHRHRHHRPSPPRSSTRRISKSRKRKPTAAAAMAATCNKPSSTTIPPPSTNPQAKTTTPPPPPPPSTTTATGNHNHNQHQHQQRQQQPIHVPASIAPLHLSHHPLALPSCSNASTAGAALPPSFPSFLQNASSCSPFSIDIAADQNGNNIHGAPASAAYPPSPFAKSPAS